MNLTSLYAPLLHSDKVFAVNKKNEFLVADCRSLEVADLHEYEKYDQLWPVLWAGKVFLRSTSSVYEITVGGDLREVWSHKRLFLLPELRVIGIDGGWRDKKISITCFDSDQRRVLWGLDSEEIRHLHVNDQIFTASGRGSTFQQSIDMETGKYLWRFQSPSNSQELRLGHVEDSWLTLSGVPHSGEGIHYIYKLDIETGEIIWEAEVPFVGYKYDAVRDQFVGFGAGRLSIIDGGSGKIRVDCSLADALERPSSQQSVKIVLDPQVGKLIFDVGSENTVIGCLDYVQQTLDWLSPFADVGTIRVNKLWFNNGLIHIFDSMDILRVGRNEGDHLQML